MSATSAPFGLRPVYHPSGVIRPRSLAGGITSGYSSTIYQGAPVKISTDGVLVLAGVGDAFLGAFAGVEYTDALGFRQVSNYWPANTTGTDIVAYFHDDPLITYEIQANGSLAQASAMLRTSDFQVVNTGSTTTGLSSATISTTLKNSSTQGNLRIVDIAPYDNNAWGDAYTIVRVLIAEHQYTYPQLGI